jgi:ribosomal protein L14E/L6E/L27E
MEIESNSVVLSLKGHDKGGSFAIIRFVDVEYALIADGKRRRVEKPKKKKLKHLIAIGSLTLLNVNAATNRQLRRALANAGTAEVTVAEGGV